MKIRHPLLIKSAARLIAQPFFWLSQTSNIRLVGETHGLFPSESDHAGPMIFSLWHDQILLSVIRCALGGEYLERHRVAALVSQHQDGGILADFMRNFYIDAVRGSTSRGGATALRQLLTASQNRSIFITPDGPRGPRHELKPGVVFLASATGLPIVPSGFAASHFWRVQGSWTDLIVPKPYSEITVLGGKPVYVPEDLDKDGIEHYRQLVQSEMERVEAEVLAISCGSSVPESYHQVRYRAA